MVKAIKRGLKDGTIDVIATDHAPHHRDEKSKEFDMAPFGISGLETALSLSLELARESILSLSHLIEKMTLNPAKILRLGKGALRAGSDADLFILDEDKESKVEAERFISKGRNTPFAGRVLRGMPVITLCKGKVYEW